MISCLEFRREVLADPQLLPAPLALHMGECQECQHYYQGVLTQEKLFKQTLEVSVPESLAAEIRLKQRFYGQPSTLRRLFKRSWPVALAASLLLALFMGVLPSSDERLAQEVLAHLEEDAGAWKVHDDASAQLTAVLQRVNVNLKPTAAFQELGQISFAGNCVIDGYLAAHLVVQSAQGPITLLLMPKLTTDKEVQLTQGGWHAALEPFESGTLAVIGQPGADLSRYQQQLRQQVELIRL